VFANIFLYLTLEKLIASEHQSKRSWSKSCSYICRVTNRLSHL